MTYCSSSVDRDWVSQILNTMTGCKNNLWAYERAPAERLVSRISSAWPDEGYHVRTRVTRIDRYAPYNRGPWLDTTMCCTDRRDSRCNADGRYRKSKKMFDPHDVDTCSEEPPDRIQELGMALKGYRYLTMRFKATSSFISIFLWIFVDLALRKISRPCASRVKNSKIS